MASFEAFSRLAMKDALKMEMAVQRSVPVGVRLAFTRSRDGWEGRDQDANCVVRSRLWACAREVVGQEGPWRSMSSRSWTAWSGVSLRKLMSSSRVMNAVVGCCSDWEDPCACATVLLVELVAIYDLKVTFYCLQCLFKMLNQRIQCISPFYVRCVGSLCLSFR